MSKPNEDKCPSCGGTGGRHEGGCAEAPEMYKTPGGIPVRRTERDYLGDADEDGVPGWD